MSTRVRAMVGFGTASLLAATLAWGQVPLNVKVGLWEVTTIAKGLGLPPSQASKLPPEQRAKIEAAMKQMEGKPHTTKHCVKKEDLQKTLFDDKDLGADCKRTIVAATAVLQDVKVECTGDRTMSGEVRLEVVTPENVRGSAQMHPEAMGETMNVTSTFTAKWLSSDCGDVK